MSVEEGASSEVARFVDPQNKAFAGMHLLLHGGQAATINAALREARPSCVSRPGSASANAAARCYPGNRYLELVGSDLCGEAGQFAGPQNEALCSFARSHGKPFALPEWGVNGSDYPDFVRYVCKFLCPHARVELATYYKSQPGSPFDLATKSGSRQVPSVHNAVGTKRSGPIAVRS